MLIIITTASLLPNRGKYQGTGACQYGLLRIARLEQWEYPCDNVRKAPSSMASLEARVMNRLQEQRQGQTIEELQQYLKEPEGRILSVLRPLRDAGFAARSNSGVWTMVRENG